MPEEIRIFLSGLGGLGQLMKKEGRMARTGETRNRTSEVSGEGMEQCEGIYSNPAYGEIEIRIKEAKLYLYFRDQKVPVLRRKMEVCSRPA